MGIICFCVEVNVLDVWRLFLSLLKSNETEIEMNVTSIPITIHQNSFRVTGQIKNGLSYHRAQVHKHTDVSITCWCVEVIVSDKWKLFASLLKLAKYEFNKNPTSNSNSVH